MGQLRILVVVIGGFQWFLWFLVGFQYFLVGFAKNININHIYMNILLC